LWSVAESEKDANRHISALRQEINKIADLENEVTAVTQLNNEEKMSVSLSAMCTFVCVYTGCG